jgi:hypothetical protein
MDYLKIAALGGDAATAMEVKKLLPDISLATIRDGLATGAPLVELAFWNLDHEETIALARRIIAALRTAGLTPVLYEDDDEEPFGEERLENKFARWAEQKRRDEELKKLGHK